MRMRSFAIACLVAATTFLSSASADAGQRVALSIGVSNYVANNPLGSPVRDATEVAQALAGFGFDVTLVRDPTNAMLNAAVDAFIARARGADAAVVYFSGHGMQLNGEPYLLATDTRVTRPDQLRNEVVAVNDIVDRLQAAGVGFKFVIIDACRNNPYARNGGNALNLANVGLAEGRQPVSNALVTYASASGQVSQDWNGRIGMSLYTAALLDVMRRHQSIDVRDLTIQARLITEQQSIAAGRPQNPSEVSSLNQIVRLVRAPGRVVAANDNELAAAGARRPVQQAGRTTPDAAPGAPTRRAPPASIDGPITQGPDLVVDPRLLVVRAARR